MELNLSRPLVFFDLETTGVVVGKDRIIEISMIKLFPGGTTETLTMRLNPGTAIPPETTRIHGITDDDIKDCPRFSEKAGEIVSFINNCDLSGYNVLKFDFPLLVEEFFRANIAFDYRKIKIIDVQNIFHKMEQRTLAAAYKFYCGKELINAHSAEADTLATLEILKAQLDRYIDAEYKDREGRSSKPVVNDVKALHDFSIMHPFADLVGHIIFNEEGTEVFNFGKHKGKSVSATFIKEPPYFNWMMNADFPESTKRLIQAIRLRDLNSGSVTVK